jgi:hypothetical protein
MPEPESIIDAKVRDAKSVLLIAARAILSPLRKTPFKPSSSSMS